MPAPESSFIEDSAAQLMRDFVASSSAPNPLGVIALGLAIFDIEPQSGIRIRQRLATWQRDSFRTDIQEIYALRLGSQLLGVGGWGRWEQHMQAQLPGREIVRVERAEECVLSPGSLGSWLSGHPGVSILSSLSQDWPMMVEQKYPGRREELLAMAHEFQSRLLTLKLEQATPHATTQAPRTPRL